MHEFRNEQFTKMVKMAQRGSELFISQARRQVGISTKTQTYKHTEQTIKHVCYS